MIIGNGRIVAPGSRAELLAGSGSLVRAVDDAAHQRAAPSSAGIVPVLVGLWRIVRAEVRSA